MARRAPKPAKGRSSEKSAARRAPGSAASPPRGWLEAARAATARRVEAPEGWRRAAAKAAQKKAPERKGSLPPRAAPGPSSASPRRERERDYAAEYKRRIERLMSDGYSRAEARGHARKKKGEMGVKWQRHMVERVVFSENKRERKELREALLNWFDVKYFPPESAFHRRRSTRDGVKGPADWHDRRELYEKIAEHLNQMFGIPLHEAFSLLFSP